MSREWDAYEPPVWVQPAPRAEAASEAEIDCYLTALAAALKASGHPVLAERDAQSAAADVRLTTGEKEMALGDQSKALRIISKAKGWDPTVVEGFSGADADLTNFDKAPNPWELGDQSVGELPGGAPESFDAATEQPLREAVPFATPSNPAKGSDMFAKALAAQQARDWNAPQRGES